MARLPYPASESLSDPVRRMLQGTPLNVVRMAAHASPAMFEAQGRLSYVIADPEVLDPRLRETAILRVAYLSDSAYELHHHLPLGRAAGLTELELEALGRGQYEAIDPLLAAVASFVDEVVTRLSPSDAVLERLRALVPDRTIVNLVMVTGHYMSVARLIAVTGPELDVGSLEALPTGID